MCFSATASFTAAAGLGAIGALTWQSVQRPAERLFATMPALFAVQQLIEGVLWLSFDHPGTAWRSVATLAYAMFAHVLWPTLVPLAVLLMERPGRRRVLLALLAAGSVVSAWLLYAIVAHGVFARPHGEHIEYVTTSALALASTALYVVAIGVSMLVSSHGMVRLFGALALLAFVVVEGFYARWLVSVWCYFAALLSGVVYLHVRGATGSLRKPARCA